ncbi:MAG: PEP-CTERM sorting domain-containing protein [Microcoleus sp.]
MLHRDLKCDRPFLIPRGDRTSGDFTEFGTAIEKKLAREIEPISSEPVPEPTTVLGTLAFGAVVSSWRMKRKQQQKVLNSTVA